VKKLIRFLLYFIGGLISLAVLTILVTVVAVDKTPLREKDFYKVMSSRLDSVNTAVPTGGKGKFHVGFSKVNLVPPFPVATAGYGNRRGKKYSAIHDSVFVRTIVISTGTTKAAIVSADLLIIPPAVTEVLRQRLPPIGFTLDNTYLNATHTHNSIGNWAQGAMELIYGSYNDSIVHFIADKITESIRIASANMVACTIKSGEVPLASAVRHRIVKGAPLDSLVRVLEFVRADSMKLIALSYTAHATCLYSKDLELSRDYPGKLVDRLEEQGYDFAMFLSGAVGSHGCNPPEYGKGCIDWMANEIASRVLTRKDSLKTLRDSTLLMVRIPLELGEAQFRVAQEWRLRPSVFHWMAGQDHPYLTALRIGSVIMLGTPCDFSGELSSGIDSLAHAKDFHTIITSFNGGYIGYITHDKYYEIDHYETRLMNWYGPGNGAYVSEAMQRLLECVTQ
jgi:neutral ceramidase